MFKKRTLTILAALLMATLMMLTATPTTVSAAGAVVPLDAWPATPQLTGTTGDLSGTFSIQAGTNRLLLVLVCCVDSVGSSGQTFSATYGGKPLSQAYLQNNYRRQTWIGYLKESDIASRTGNDVAVTVTGVHDAVAAYIASYSGVNQVTPITDTGGTWINDQDNVAIGGPLDVNAGGYGIYGWSSSRSVWHIGDTEGYTEHSDVQGPSGTHNRGVASKYFSTTGTTNPIVDWNSQIYASVSFITLNPATPRIYVNKYADEASVKVGETIHYSYELTNETGGGDITSITVVDDKCGSPVRQDDISGDDDDTLEDGEEWLYRCEYVATFADLVAGSVLNEATASGLDPDEAAVENTDTCEVDVIPPDPVANPLLSPCCGLDVVLVLDSSKSIDPADQVKDSAKVFVNALLPDTDTLIGVVDFDTTVVGTPLDLTDNITAINAAIDAITKDGGTNWEAGLTEARLMLENGYSEIIDASYASDRDDTVYPDLTILFSDGTPETYGYPDDLGATGGLDPEDIGAAIIAANAAKTSTATEPIRVLYAGIGQDLTNGQLVSGGNVADPSGEPPTYPGVDTDAMLADLPALGYVKDWADAIAEQAHQCGTITVEKQADGSTVPFHFALDSVGDLDGAAYFDLYDDEQETMNNLATGLYYADEVDIPLGWELSSISIAEDGTVNSTYDVSAARAQINLDAGETVQIVFSNSESEEPTPIHPPPPPHYDYGAVGGEAYPVNKLGLVAPWVALTVIIAAGGLYLVRRRVNNQI